MWRAEGVSRGRGWPIPATTRSQGVHAFPVLATINFPGHTGHPSRLERCGVDGYWVCCIAASLRIVDPVREPQFHCALFFNKSLTPLLQPLNILFVDNSRFHSASRQFFQFL